ncbi:putative signal-transduction protein containing cAMP-binding and CBS domains [Desulfitobacterium dichloroeliminans LMG P-21439]|uniref:Putative signal-transduction protein containing cAMP-binding and CBS domains n=1 Tax=Desulfitobacterium dichloroeliminans (strain LMG P-21439 / DCA1) TaxID=871963 RepID=L0FAW2_DESDL|nr:helix-turn-helix transcriptional regulator [Desulfitobacterium dichloroeliminans]AGA70362.1 putative signal-transduction protein containing cAMP-binding and CBS domains [Desulfitobacterium dichloroeliminans LMG P-21439]
MEFSERQARIVEIVKSSSPITGEQIAAKLDLTRATLRPDLTILTMAGILDARPRVGYFLKEQKESSPIMEQLRLLRVGDFKSLPISVRENISIYDAIVTMFTQNVGTLTVVGENQNLKGMVSRKDLLKSALGKTDLQQVPVSIIMTRMPNIIMTTADEPILDAARKLTLHQIDSLPVVEAFIDEKGEERYEVIGRFTKTNVAKIFVQIGTLGKR